MSWAIEAGLWFNKQRRERNHSEEWEQSQDGVKTRAVTQGL